MDISYQLLDQGGSFSFDPKRFNKYVKQWLKLNRQAIKEKMMREWIDVQILQNKQAKKMNIKPQETIILKESQFPYLHQIAAGFIQTQEYNLTCLNCKVKMHSSELRKSGTEQPNSGDQVRVLCPYCNEELFNIQIQ